jgi:hypothetical protein
MPDVEIVKLKVRRGTDSQRSITVLEQGELGYTNDYSRLWVGDGTTAGGTIVGNVVHDSDQPRVSINGATKGDIVYENGKLYRLNSTTPVTEADWEFIGTKIDSTFIEYNTQDEISLKDSCITTTQIDSGIVLATGGIDFNVADGLSINVDDITIEKPSNTLQLKLDSIDETYIKSTTIGSGLTGGSGQVIELDVETTYLGFAGNKLSLTGIPNGIVSVDSLSSHFIGKGLRISPLDLTLETTIQAVDANFFTISAVEQPDESFTDTLTFDSKFLGNQSRAFTDILTFDAYGRLDGSSSSLDLPLSAESTVTTVVSGGVNVPFLSGAFNGGLDQTDYNDQTIIDTLSTVGGTTYIASLTSAGFIQMDMGGTTGVVAIPVFRPPTS